MVFYLLLIVRIRSKNLFNFINATNLKGDRKGIYSMTVSGNYRITFEFINGDAYILNYEDYH